MPPKKKLELLFACFGLSCMQMKVTQNSFSQETMRRFASTDNEPVLSPGGRNTNLMQACDCAAPKSW